MTIIGLTGSIATGKSTISSYLQTKQIPVVDEDLLAREVVEPGTPGIKQLEETFGQRIIHLDGTLNRGALGDLLFHNDWVREKVNAILHPLIFGLLDQRVAEYQAQQEPIIVVDIPLLYEEKGQDHVDEVWVVYVPEAVQLERLMQRNNLRRAEAKVKIETQLPIEDKAKWADVVIDNSKTKAESYQQVDKELERLNQAARV